MQLHQYEYWELYFLVVCCHHFFVDSSFLFFNMVSKCLLIHGLWYVLLWYMTVSEHLWFACYGRNCLYKVLIFCCGLFLIEQHQTNLWMFWRKLKESDRVYQNRTRKCFLMPSWRQMRKVLNIVVRKILLFV